MESTWKLDLLPPCLLIPPWALTISQDWCQMAVTVPPTLMRCLFSVDAIWNHTSTTKGHKNSKCASDSTGQFWHATHPRSVCIPLLLSLSLVNTLSRSIRYYQQIKNQLRSYDCVLFEGIGDVNSTDVEGVSASKKVINSHSKEANRLALVCQNNFIFEVQSWKKADLPWTTFAQLEEERLIRWKELENQEGRKIKRVLQIMPDILKHLLSNHSFWMPVPAFVPLITYLTCLCNGPNAHDIDKLEEMFKLGILHYFVKNPKFSRASEVVYEYDEDCEGDSNYTRFAVLIRERNKFAIEVLKKAIAEGKMSIAILFGAGHMADFHKRLVKELNMVPVTVEWGTAWSIKEGPKSKLIHPLLDKFQREDRTFILSSLIFSFLVVDLWAWRTGFGLHYCMGCFLGL